MKYRYLTICICFLSISFTFHTFPVHAGEDGGIEEANKDPVNISISGSNTLRLEHYNTSGDEDASNYQFEGPQSYDQFGLNFDTLMNPYSKVRGQISGVINESDYRNRDRGFVPERLNLMHEKGDFFLPYRFEVGDYYSFFSQRTEQRSLKGMRLELQPKVWMDKERHISLQLTAGYNQDTWKEFSISDDFSKGTSLLFTDPVFGRWNLNYVRNTRKGKQPDGTMHRTQDVLGLAANKTISIGNQKVSLEAEIDYFRGDHDGVETVASGKDRDDNALFFELSGKSDLPLTYRLRFEDYGQDYRPNGVVVSPDRLTREAHVGWQFKSGTKVQGRFQHFKDGVETSNPIDTYTTGIIISGPLFKNLVNDLSGNINTYVQDVENRSKTSNSTTQTVTANFSKPLFAGWNGNIDLFYQDVDNHSQETNDTVTRQARLSIDHALKFYGFKGNVRPGVSIRQIDNISSGTDDIFPTLAVNLQKGNHSFGYDMGYNIQNVRVTTSTDVKTLTQNFVYSYAKNSDTFGMEINTADRNPDPGHVSKSVRAAVYWTHSFGRNFSLKRRTGRGALHKTGAVALPYPSRRGMVDLGELIPYADINKIKERLAVAKIKGGIERNNLIVYEASLLNEFDQRQRLALVHEDGILQKAALIIEFDNVGNLDSMRQTYERVRKKLMDRYGNPFTFFERGEFSENIVADVNNGSFIRTVEWRMPEGVIRYGIPRRLDGRIRMEVQFSTGFTPIEGNNLWSVERVK